MMGAGAAQTCNLLFAFSISLCLVLIVIALLHDDVTIKTFIKILLFNAKDHGRLTGTKQRKFTENRPKTGINSRREVE